MSPFSLSWYLMVFTTQYAIERRKTNIVQVVGQIVGQQKRKALQYIW